MNVPFGAAITEENVEEFRRKMREQRETNSPAKAKKRLIESGALTKNGEPRWPTQENTTKKERIALRKAK
jgi:hypothetical protein